MYSVTVNLTNPMHETFYLKAIKNSNVPEIQLRIHSSKYDFKYELVIKLI